MTVTQEYNAKFFLVVNLTLIYHKNNARSVTFYNYGFNNPIKYNDPTGKDGEVIENDGTQTNPDIIHAAYYYQNGSLSNAEVKGLNDAASAYNNAKPVQVKGRYVKYNIEVQEVDDSNAAKVATEFTDKNGESRFYGNIVEANETDQDKFGSANSWHIGINSGKITNAIKNGELTGLIKGTFIHEIGHTLGGLHEDINSVMYEGINPYPKLDNSFTKTVFNRRDALRYYYEEASKRIPMGRLWTLKKQ
ncbi:MAG: hypothetical protein LBT04_06295 [Prevotellaceae bacterium]|jgi:predicted Zn-dependent protease with MMP-like domain|nr:hypothetical protein [Prevotellaceae bacterium]